MKPGKEEFHSIAEVVAYLQAMPADMKVRTMVVEGNPFTLLFHRKEQVRRREGAEALRRQRAGQQQHPPRAPDRLRGRPCGGEGLHGRALRPPDGSHTEGSLMSTVPLKRTIANFDGTERAEEVLAWL